MLASDLIIVPLQSSGADKWSTEKILKLIEEDRFYKAGLNAVMAVNRNTVGTAIGRHFKEGVEADYPEFPVLQTEIGQYAAFAEALTAGRTVPRCKDSFCSSFRTTGCATRINVS